MDIDERILRVLGERWDVGLVYIFGSTAAGTARPGSDADIAILFDAVPAAGVLDHLSDCEPAECRRCCRTPR